MSIANTNSLTTDLNVDPYYDDYAEGKNYYRILFRPGQAVQGRELTQMQTIQQNQIDRFAEHIFTEGSPVRGCEVIFDPEIEYIKLRDDDLAAASVNAAAFVGTSITGNTSGVTAVVLDSLDGSEAADPNTKTLYVKYTSSGSNNTTKRFLSNEILNANSGISANVATGTAATITNAAIRVTIGEGVIFAKDHFIRVDRQSIIASRYSTTASIRVGYDVDESIVSSSTDLTLLDPAQGSYNYVAPGADRLKIVATLTTKATTATDLSDFVERVRIKDGAVDAQIDQPLYSVINDYIARRTYDESGNYLVNGLSTRMREHLNSANNGGVYTAANGGDANKITVDVSPGKAYVNGYEIQNISTSHVAVDKGTDYESIESISIPANYGNYVVVDEVVGEWDVMGHDRVDLYDTAQNAISSGTLSATSPSGSKIGEARVRAVVYASGTRGDYSGTYNMHLYDISMSGGAFGAVKSIFFNNGSVDAFADPVLVSGAAVLVETSFNRGVYNIPASNIRTLRDDTNALDNSFRFQKTFDVTVAADGTFSINTGLSDEQFPFSITTLNDTQERENFHLVLQGAANTATTLETTASRTQSANAVTGLTSATTKYTPGDRIKLQGDANTFIISAITSATEVALVGDTSTVGPALAGSTLFKEFESGQVISFNGFGGDAAARSIAITGTTTATFDIQETLSGTVAASIVCDLNKVDGQEIAKGLQSDRYVQVRVSDSTNGAPGPWNLGVSDGFKLKEVRVKTGNAVFSSTSEGSDVTDQFSLNSGMKDNFYDHSKLVIKNAASHVPANGNVYLVKMDYFTHDTSQGVGYLSVDSYPIDDANTANTTAITTGEIPVFNSPTDGLRFNLRDAVDIRPRIVDTANNTTSLTNISINPAVSTTIVEPSGGLHFIPPNESMITDLDYYLPRRDRVVITSAGKFRIIKGEPNLIPRTPDSPADGMTIAVVNVGAYPTLPQENAKRIGRADLSVSVDPVRTRRYTMKDIATLDQRIENLEYYTSLSLLESDTKNLFLSDSSGVDRFKNGIAVDQFVDFTLSDFYDPDFKVAIDKKSKELRPTFRLTDVQLEYKSANSSNIADKPNDATLVLTTTPTYSNGETITAGSASGTLLYQVGSKLYIKETTGTFGTSANAVGGTSGSTAAVTSATLPSSGKLISLPYTHDAVIDQSSATDTRNATGYRLLAGYNSCSIS